MAFGFLFFISPYLDPQENEICSQYLFPSNLNLLLTPQGS